MNEPELKNLWQTTSDRLEAGFVIQQKNTDDLTQIKLFHFLNDMKPVKIFALLVGMGWVGIGLSLLVPVYLHGFAEANPFFLFSATAQVGITAIALGVYLRQLITLYQVDITDPIIRTQQKLAQLQLSTLWVTRILFLQLPVWTTFWWTETLFTDGHLIQWIIPVSVTLLFTYASVWLFRNIRYENRNQKWFQLLFSGREWTPLMKAIALIEQVEEYSGPEYGK